MGDDMNTVEKINAKLAHMEEYWAKSRSELFPKGVWNITDLRASLEKQDMETASEPSNLVVDVWHITTTTITAISTNTATPAIHEATTLLDCDTCHIITAPAPVQIQMGVELAPTALPTPVPGQSEVELTTNTAPPMSIKWDNIEQLNNRKVEGIRGTDEWQGKGVKYGGEQQEESAEGQVHALPPHHWGHDVSD